MIGQLAVGYQRVVSRTIEAEGTSTDRLAVFDRGDLGHGHTGLGGQALAGPA
jgi:hypothetical protein